MKVMIWFALASGCFLGFITAWVSGLTYQMPYFAAGFIISAIIFVIKLWREM